RLQSARRVVAGRAALLGLVVHRTGAIRRRSRKRAASLGELSYLAPHRAAIRRRAEASADGSDVGVGSVAVRTKMMHVKCFFFCGRGERSRLSQESTERELTHE